MADRTLRRLLTWAGRSPMEGLGRGAVAVGLVGVAALVPLRPALGQDAEPAGDQGQAKREPGQPGQEGQAPSPTLESEEALARFRQLLQQRPFHGPAFEELVKHYVERGKLQELLAEYKLKAEALPDDVPLRVVLARLHLRSGDAAAAAAIMDATEALPPAMARSTSDLLVLKAEIYQRTGNNEAAERVLRQAQEHAASISERLRLGEALADVYLRAGRRDEAVAALRALAGQFADNYPHQRQIAGALAQRGLHEAAVEQYRAMLPLVKDEVDRRCELLREMGLSLERLGKRDDAIAAYVEAVGMLASDHWLQRDLHERIVNLYRAASRLEDLAAYCRSQITRSPEQTAMRVLLADVHSAMGRPEEGKRVLAEAAMLFPKDLALSQKRVEFLERLGDIEGMSAEYQRAIGQHPGDHELYVSYGQSLANSKQIEAARSQWRHVLGTKVDDPMLAVRLGALFESYELYDDAAEAYERAIAAGPKRPEPYAALSRLWLARGDAEKAVGVLDRMGQANPDDGPVQAARAQALRNLGKAPEALDAITRACELLPDQSRYQQMRAELLVQNGRLDEALEVRRGIIDRMTNPVQRADAIATLVSMYASADRLASLAQAEEKRLAEKPGDAASLLLLARIADTRRDFPEMRRRLDALLAADPGNETALGQLAKLHDATGDINAAVEVYTRLIQRHPARARQFYEAIVDLRLRYNDRAGAIDSLEGMAKGDPTGAATQAAVADQLVRMGDAERALPYFEKCLQIQPDRHESRLDYGKALSEVGRLDDALAVFRAVATQRTDTDRAAEAIGRMHDVATQLGKLEELTDDLRQQVEADPQNTTVARALAQLLVRELEYGRAMDMLDLVLRHNPRDADLALARAEVLRRLARFEEAAEAYQGVLRFPQIDRDFVLGDLGKTQFEAGQVDQARRLWRQIQNKLYAGSLLKNNGLLEEAIDVLEEGIRLKPDDYALHRNLIGALESAGRTAEALDAARRLLDLEPGNVMNIEQVARAYLRSGDREGAASVAARLFSAGVGADRAAAQGGGSSSVAMAMAQAMYAGSYYRGGPVRSNLDRAVEFFMENGLQAELDEALTSQMAAQPGNAMLKRRAATLFTEELNKPELALSLLRELETATFPLEQQTWLGECSQRDYMRIEQYNLIAQKPALRDRELAALEAKSAADLTRDELIELAIIRSAQGNTESAVEVLTRALGADAQDVIALGVLTDMLVAGEKFDQAEPHARRLADVLAAQRERMHADTMERVRRDFVRALPVEFQLRITDALLSDIAEKWTLGEGWSWWEPGAAQAVGYLRARLTLGTICAKTGRMDEARKIWTELAPQRAPDVDRLTTLGDTVQLHGQEDLAFDFYSRALAAARTLSGDPLLRQIYAASTSQRSWYGDEGGIDKAFNSIVEAFSKRGRLIELYDFLRDTNQEQRARRLAEQYKLTAELRPLYERRVADAAAAFRASPDPLRASPSYFAQVCKLAELHDRAGDWEEARGIYEAYLADFPDELGLLTMLGEVAEARLKTDEAIEWERKVLDCKARLAKKARDWSMRDLDLIPALPQPLGNGRMDPWSWTSRWSGDRWSGYGSQGELDRWSSWMRLSQLYLAADNTIAAADAMQRAVGEAGPQRDAVIRQCTGLIRQRQLTAKMLPVLRTLAVYAPADENVQLAFAESLEAGGRKELALEVCNRMLRRGVSDLGVLAEVRRRVASLNPESTPPEATLATLEAEAAADKANLKARLRLAKAYFYSLDLGRAHEQLSALAREAPHLEDVHQLLVEVQTLRGDTEGLLSALRAQIERTTDDGERRSLRWRLVDELLGAGRSEEALALVRELGDPRDPHSYVRVGRLLQYFGRHDEAIACLRQAGKSRRGGQYDERGADFSVAMALAIQGQTAQAADEALKAVAESSRQQVQYGGMYGLYGDNSSPFAAIEHAMAIYPDLAAELGRRLEAQRQEKPSDPQAAKLLMAFYRSTGRPDKAEALMDQIAAASAADQSMVLEQITRAVQAREFERAIAMAQRFIAQTPKPQVPPGMPAQYAGMAVLQSPRTMMICKLGDIYWDLGQKDKALETYRQIVDEKVDETRIAFATISLVRERAEEARKLVDEALAAQQVKAPSLLQLRAFIAALDGQVESALDALVLAAQSGGDEEDAYGSGGSPLQTMASLAARAGLVDRFAAFARERIKSKPADWEAYSTLARVYWQAGRPDEAMAVLDQAAAVPSLLQQALSQRLMWERRLRSPEALIPIYEKLIELAERDVGSDQRSMMYRGGSSEQSPGQSYRNELGGLLWEKGDREAAQRVWSERMNIQRAGAHLQLARLYTSRGEHELAAKSFARAAELDPDNVQAHTAVARAAFARGDRATALRHMVECFVLRADAEEPQTAYGRQPRGAEDQGLGEIAVAIAADPKLDSYLSDAALAERAGECRIMLRAMSGDWAGLEAALKPRIEAGDPDPLVWRLWARAQQRKGDWKEAARALEFLRRADLTSISRHREQLKLVLAGRQLKEAAVGVRQAQPGAGPQPGGRQSYSRMSSYGYWDEGPSGSGVLLPTVCIKLGDMERAERLYLISGQGGLEGRLPALASLLWKLKGKERGLELMRMALSLPSDRYGRSSWLIPQYAAMLAEAGQADAAADLLVRAYRWNSAGDRDSVYYSMYGYSGEEEQFEQGEEAAVSQALYAILMKAGTFEQRLRALAEQSKTDPADPTLAKLVLSLQKHGGRWADLREALAARRAARPGDVAAAAEQFHAECQLGRWDDALALVSELRRLAPQQKERWAAHESFVRLMSGDGAGAAAALAPVLDAVGDEDEQGARRAALTILAVTRKHAELAEQLERQRAAGGLDNAGNLLLFRVMVIRQQWPEALALGLEGFWRQDDVLTPWSGWWPQLNLLAQRAAAAGASLATPQPAPADAALLTLLAQGPAAGLKAFSDLASQPEPTLESLLGLQFAAMLAGDEAAELAASERLVAWLSPRRAHAWYTPPGPGIQRLAQNSARQMGSAGSMQVVQSSSYESAIGSIVDQRSGGPPTVAYEALWDAQLRAHWRMLARAGDGRAVRDAVRAGARSLLGGANRGDDYRASNAYSASVLSSMAQYGGFYPGFDEDYSEQEQTDPDAALRDALKAARRHDLLLAEFDRLGGRTPAAERRVAEEAAAACGQVEAAAEARRRRARVLLAELRSGDLPDLGASDVDPWRWSYGFGADAAGRETEKIRSALLGATSGEDQPDRSAVRGPATALWQLAAIDPEIERELQAAAADAGPGWCDSRTVAQLVALHRAKRRPKDLLELLDRTGSTEEIARSNQLSGYVWACMETRSADRLEAVLAAAQRGGAALDSAAALMRLAMLRRTGQAQKADELEATLIARCVKDQPNPHRPAPDLSSAGAPVVSWEDPQEGADAWERARYVRSMRSWYARQAVTIHDLPRVADLANAMGVRYEDRIRPEDVTLAHIRHAYQRHNLHADAARILAIEMKQAASPEERWDFMMALATSQHRAGQADAAKAAARELEASLTAEMKGGARPDITRRLYQLYTSKAYGQDYARALELLNAAGSAGSPADPSRGQTVHCLYELGRHKEAWDLCAAAIRAGAPGFEQEKPLYEAALSACLAGDKETGARLARLALFRYPDSPLAQKAREMIDGR